jgi:hypothetical protein
MPVLNSQGPASGSAVHEMVYVHLDKQVYIAGESIRYKAYLVSSTGSNLPCSKIIYFNLTGSGIENRLDWRINLESSSAAGSLLLPEDLKPGIYVLTAYTNWMRNSPASTYFSDRILVTSLKSEGNPAIRFFNAQGPGKRLQPDMTEIGDEETSLNFHAEKSEYTTDESVRFELDLKHSSKVVADISVSVYPVSPFDSMLLDPEMNEFINSGLARVYSNRKPAACLHKIEDRGFILSGRIIPNQNAPIDRCDVWLAVTDSISPRILFSKVDTTGAFRFFLDRTYDNQELIIQLADASMSSECKLEVFSKTAMLADTATNSYILDAEEQAYLSTVKNIRLIEAIYGNNEQKAVSVSLKTGPAFLSMPNRVVIPSEYADLRNFREIASNILPEVRFGNRRDEFYLEVLSPNINLWKDNFVVMLNGVPFTDLVYISTLGTKDIKRIEIIQPNVLVGDMTLPGMVSIYTYDNQIPENYLRSHTVRFQNKVITSLQEMRF